MTQNIKRYSEAFRRQVVKEYEAGETITDLQKKYGITGGQTIQAWIKKYARAGLRTTVVRIQTAEEVNRVRQLEKQVEELERALARTTLEKLFLESVVEELQLQQGDEQVKKNAAPSSSGTKTNAGRKRA